MKNGKPPIVVGEPGIQQPVKNWWRERFYARGYVVDVRVVKQVTCCSGHSNSNVILLSSDILEQT